VNFLIVLCYYSDYCQGETYDKDGINEIYIQPLKFIQKYLSSSLDDTNNVGGGVLSTVFATLIPILFMSFYIIEQLLLMNTSPLFMMAMGLLGVAVFVGSSKSSFALRMMRKKMKRV